MTREESQLADIVARIIDIRRAQPRINPSWIATEALKEIDPSNRSVALVRTGCHLELRQIARAQCRKLFEDGEDDDEPLFDAIEGLQWRYPTARSKQQPEPEYILREHMTEADLVFNVMRLRLEGQAKLRHADTLEAWGHSRKGVA
jgi:hypothetical protein